MAETKSYKIASHKIAIVWRGDHATRQTATPQNNRYHRIFEELAALGIQAAPAVFDEEFADEFRDQLLTVDGVLVWVNPLQDGVKTRAVLDPLLRDVAVRGPWVSAHPDVILKRAPRRCSTAPGISAGAPTRSSIAPRPNFAIASQRGCTPRARVCSSRTAGNDGQGVWKVEPASARAGGMTIVRVLQALRGCVPEELPLREFITRCKAYFAADGCIIDQPFQPRLPDGMIRCYMAGDKVAGFGHQ